MLASEESPKRKKPRKKKKTNEGKAGSSGNANVNAESLQPPTHGFAQRMLSRLQQIDNATRQRLVEGEVRIATGDLVLVWFGWLDIMVSCRLDRARLDLGRRAFGLFVYCSASNIILLPILQYRYLSVVYVTGIANESKVEQHL